MFSCLNYGNHNKVVPDRDSPEQQPYFDLYQFPHDPIPEKPFEGKTLNKTAIISIAGMGSDIPTMCKKLRGFNVYYHNLNYNTGGLFKDFGALRKDSNGLDKTSPNYSLVSHERMYLLMNLMKKYLLKYNIDNVVVIGFSHGSLLVHGAFLKLQMDMDSQLQENIKTKLKIYTIGSPRYLPQGLIPRTEITNSILPPLQPLQPLQPTPPTLLNFYHVKDPFVTLLNKIKIIPGSKVPDLNLLRNIKPNFIKECPIEYSNNNQQDPEHYYDSTNALVFVNRCNYMPDHITDIYDDMLPNYFMPLWYKKVKEFIMNNAKLYHASGYILYPIMDFYTRYFLATPKTMRKPNRDVVFITLDSTHGGGAKAAKAAKADKAAKASKVTKTSKVPHIQYQDKVYPVKKDAVGKFITVGKNKTYLTTIKGKYRIKKDTQ